MEKDKKDLTVGNVLIEIDNVRIQMHNLYDDIKVSELETNSKTIDDIIHEKWIDTLPSFLLERFSIPKKEFNSKRYAKEQADKMFKEDIIDDMIDESKLIKTYCSCCKCKTFQSPSYYDGWMRCHKCNGC